MGLYFTLKPLSFRGKPRCRLVNDTGAFPMFLCLSEAFSDVDIIDELQSGTDYPGNGIAQIQECNISSHREEEQAPNDPGYADAQKVQQTGHCRPSHASGATQCQLRDGIDHISPHIE